MRISRVLGVLALSGLIGFSSPARALPLITSATETASLRIGNPPVAGTVDPAGMVISSASNPGPGTPPNGALVDESWAYTDRTHELTAPRTNAAGVLSTAATDTLRVFPYYLQGLEYIQTSNDNRDLIDYRIDVTLSAPVTAFLFLDNRNNGPASLNNHAVTDDPALGGPLQWVIDDGWTRVKSGQMPNNQSDYVGADEGDGLASNLASDRTHTSSANLVAGSGNGLNNFFAIYRKNFAAGTHTGLTKQNGIAGANMYVVAVSPTLGPIIAGDANNNGVVDINDYIIIRNNFQGTNKTRATGDVNFDTVVNFTDFRMWKNNRTPGAAGSELSDADLLGGLGVPEPGSLMLALIGSVAWLTGARRRIG
jgi:hypothetical protein